MANIKAIHRLSLYDPANGDIVLLNRLATDGGYEKEPIATEVSDGTIFGGYTHTLTAIFFDMPDGARAQLESWEEAGTELNCVGLSGTGALLWYHPTEMTGFMDSLQTNARDGVSPFQFELTTAVPYADIYTGTNILRAAMKRNNATNRTQYDQTELYIPKRRLLNATERYALEDFGIKSTASSGVSQLQFAFPMPNVAFFASTEADSQEQFSLMNKNYSGDQVGGPNNTQFNSVLETNTFSTTFYLRWQVPADVESSKSYMRIDKAEYTNE